MGKRALITVMAILAGPAHADPTPYQTSDGQEYLFVGADVGGLLYPATNPEDWHELMPDCTARRPDGTTGQWEWANGGWLVRYGDTVAVGFPRQEAPMTSPTACQSQ